MQQGDTWRWISPFQWPLPQKDRAALLAVTLDIVTQFSLGESDTLENSVMGKEV